MSNINEEDVRKVFQQNINQEDVKKAVEKSNELLKKVESGFLFKEIAKIKLLTRMLKDYFSGTYMGVPLHTIATVVIINLYIINPIDLIPDFIPVAGQVDDLAVLIAGWKLIQEDVKEYAKWKIENGEREIIALYEEAFGFRY